LEVKVKNCGLLFITALLALASQTAIALTIEELEQGLGDALNFTTANTAIAIYVNGYITGSANYAQSIGTLCVDGKSTSSLDLMREVRLYIQENPEEKDDGAQLIINRALNVAHRC
jgi:hypothetical protein